MKPVKKGKERTKRAHSRRTRNHATSGGGAQCSRTTRSVAQLISKFYSRTRLLVFPDGRAIRPPRHTTAKRRLGRCHRFPRALPPLVGLFGAAWGFWGACAPPPPPTPPPPPPPRRRGGGGGGGGGGGVKPETPNDARQRHCRCCLLDRLELFYTKAQRVCNGRVPGRKSSLPVIRRELMRAQPVSARPAG